MYKISGNNLTRDIDHPSNISKSRYRLYGNLIDKSLMDFSKICQPKHIIGRYHFLLEMGNIPRSKDVNKEISNEVCQLWNKMMIICFPGKSA